MSAAFHQEAEEGTESDEAAPDGEEREAEELRAGRLRDARGQELELLVQVAVQGHENEDEPGQEQLR